METSSFVLVVIMVALVAAGFFIIKLQKKKLARLTSEQREARYVAAQRESKLVNDSQTELRNLHSEHELAMRNFQQDKDVELSRITIELETVRNEKAQISSQLFKTFERSDLVSRRQIIDACNDLQLDGALLTNVNFSPANRHSTDKKYYSQADHLLVTARGIAVIEGKCWSMMVFDGLDPKKHLPSLASILRNISIDQDEGEVLHIWDPDAQWNKEADSRWAERKLSLQVRSSPHKQAKKHAWRLKELLANRAPGAVEWIDTCVFYSYESAQVYHLPTFKGTSVVATKSELKAFLNSQTFQRDRRVDVKKIVGAIQDETGDVVGFGEWRNEWHSNLG